MFIFVILHRSLSSWLVLKFYSIYCLWFIHPSIEIFFFYRWCLVCISFLIELRKWMLSRRLALISNQMAKYDFPSFFFINKIHKSIVVCKAFATPSIAMCVNFFFYCKITSKEWREEEEKKKDDVFLIWCIKPCTVTGNTGKTFLRDLSLINFIFTSQKLWSVENERLIFHFLLLLLLRLLCIIVYSIVEMLSGKIRWK